MWCSSLKTSHQIDHILIPKKRIKLVKDVHRVSGYISNHLALRYKINLKKYIPEKNPWETNMDSHTIPDYDKIRGSEELTDLFHDNFITCIKEKNLSEISIENKETYIDEICKTLSETANQVSSKQQNDKRRSCWFNCKRDLLLTVIATQDKACIRYADNPMDDNKRILKITQNTVQKEVKNAKREWIEGWLEKIEALNVNPKAHWNVIKKTHKWTCRTP